MGDAAVTQARDRIRAAVVNSGQKWPDRRITLALSPAALPKRGAGYDIALAVAVLAAAGVVPPRAAGDTVFIGELGLDGQVRPVRGVLPALLAARAAGRERAIVPVGNLSEAASGDRDVGVGGAEPAGSDRKPEGRGSGAGAGVSRRSGRWG